MTETEQASGSARLTAQIKIAYWIALGLIGLMATASYMLLDRKLSDHQLDRRLLSFVSSQSALSQRIVFLANEAGATMRADRPALMSALSMRTIARRMMSAAEPWIGALIAARSLKARTCGFEERISG